MEQLLGYLKLSAKAIAVLGLVALALLFAPEMWLESIGAVQFRKEHRLVLALAALVAVAYLLVEAVVAGFLVLRRRAQRKRDAQEQAAKLQREQEDRHRQEGAQRQRREQEAAEVHQRAERDAADVRQQRIDYLNRMTREERAECRKFIERDRRTVWLNADSGVVQELVERGVLRGAGTRGGYDIGFEAWGAEYTMNDWAWDYLHEHPELC